MNKNTDMIKIRRIVNSTVYNIGIRMVDLIENFYNRLKYIKLNYKTILLSIFEEKDNDTTGSVSKYHESTNKYVDLIISYLLILVGYKEENLFEIDTINSNFSFFKIQRSSSLFRQLNVIFTVSATLLFLYIEMLL